MEIAYAVLLTGNVFLSLVLTGYTFPTLRATRSVCMWTYGPEDMLARIIDPLRASTMCCELPRAEASEVYIYIYIYIYIYVCICMLFFHLTAWSRQCLGVHHSVRVSVHSPAVSSNAHTACRVLCRK
jgi:hypothetical protein